MRALLQYMRTLQVLSTGALLNCQAVYYVHSYIPKFYETVHSLDFQQRVTDKIDKITFLFEIVSDIFLPVNIDFLQ